MRVRASGAFQEISGRALWEREAIKQSEEPHILIGTATCARAAGALDVLKTVNDELVRRNIKARVTEVGCMGYCYAEPLVVITKPGFPPICYGYVTEGVMSRLVEDFILGDDPCFEFALGALEENELIPTIFDQPRFKYETRVLLRNCGYIDPEDINQYIASDGYSGLVQALGMTAEEVIEEIKRSGLRGRGGAGFTTGDKWQICRNAEGVPKYVICNADEGDPGAFMDRAILESDPQSVIEGMIIAGYAVGASY
ncbi:MAG: NADH-quinone oxidoreductase subunit F, partial [Dehalococcoidia bacterium]